MIKISIYRLEPIVPNYESPPVKSRSAFICLVRIGLISVDKLSSRKDVLKRQNFIYLLNLGEAEDILIKCI